MSERDILNYFINAGYSKEAASAIVGTLMSESSLRHDAVNKNSGAYGYALWLGSRKKELFKRYGEHPTAQNQLDYILWELLNTHRGANDVLKNSLDINQLVDAMFGNYEFSAGKKKAILAMNNSGLNGEASLADKLKHSINTYNRYYGNISPYRAVDPNSVLPTQYFDNTPRKVLTGRVVQSPDGLYSIVDKNIPSTIAYENADKAYRMASSPTLNAPIVQANPETIAGPVLQDVNVYGRPKSPRLSVPSLMDTHRQYLNYQMLKNAGMIDEDDNDDFFKYVAVNNLMIPRFEGGKDAELEYYKKATQDSKNGWYWEQSPFNNPIIKLLDITGITSYNDVCNSSNAFDKVVNVAQSIPAIGKFPKIISGVGNVFGIKDDMKSYSDWKDYLAHRVWKDTTTGIIFKDPNETRQYEALRFDRDVRSGKIRRATDDEIEYWYKNNPNGRLAVDMRLGGAVEKAIKKK